MEPSQNVIGAGKCPRTYILNSTFHKLLIILFLKKILILSVLSLHCCMQAFSSCGVQELHFVADYGLQGLPSGASGKEPICQGKRCKRCGFYPWVGKIPWRRAWQPTPVLIPRESSGQRNLVGYIPQGCKELDMTEVTWHIRVGSRHTGFSNCSAWTQQLWHMGLVAPRHGIFLDKRQNPCSLDS